MTPENIVIFKAGDGRRTNAARQARFRERQKLARWNAAQADHDASTAEDRAIAARYAAPDALEMLDASIQEVQWVYRETLARHPHDLAFAGPSVRLSLIQRRLEREFRAAADHLPLVRLMTYVRQLAATWALQDAEHAEIRSHARVTQAQAAAKATPSPAAATALTTAKRDRREAARWTRHVTNTPVSLDDLAPLSP